MYTLVSRMKRLYWVAKDVHLIGLKTPPLKNLLPETEDFRGNVMVIIEVVIYSSYFSCY